MISTVNSLSQQQPGEKPEATQQQEGVLSIPNLQIRPVNVTVSGAGAATLATAAIFGSDIRSAIFKTGEFLAAAASATYSAASSAVSNLPGYFSRPAVPTMTEKLASAASTAWTSASDTMGIKLGSIYGATATIGNTAAGVATLATLAYVAKRCHLSTVIGGLFHRCCHRQMAI